MQKRTIVTVEGGLVREVFADDPGHEIIVVDFDTDDGKPMVYACDWLTLTEADEDVKDAIDEWEKRTA